MQSANEFINNRALVNYENIARNILYEGVFAATAKDNNDTLTITSQEVYGRYDYAVSINPNGGKKEYLIIQHLSSGINEITGCTVYIYDADGTNLQQASYLSQYKDAENNVYANIICLKNNQANGTKLVYGAIAAKGHSYVLNKNNSLIVIDITGYADYYSAEKLYNAFGYDFFEYKYLNIAQIIPDIDIPKVEESKYAYRTKLAPKLKNNFNEDDFYIFGGGTITYDSNTKKVIANSSSTYGALKVFSDAEDGHTYMVIYKGRKLDNFGLIKLSGTAWITAPINTINYNNIEYNYAYLKYEKTMARQGYYIQVLRQNTEETFEIVCIADVSDFMEITENTVKMCIDNKTLEYNLALSIFDLYSKDKSSNYINFMHNNWNSKKVLVIGDSITAAGRWQLKLNELLSMQVTTHAKGGVGTIAMVDGDKGLGGDYDNTTSANGVLKPLTKSDVFDKDLIIVLPAYNDRGKVDGDIGDCYKTDGTGDNTIAGVIQYTINRIYEELEKADNLTCKIMYATPHCAGRYPYIDADGYMEYPSGTGRTMETLANTIIKVCNHNNIKVCDLWHNSGINKFTWDVFGSSSSAENSKYSPYKLNSDGNKVSESRIRYVNGQSYYQNRDGKIVLEQYTGSAPFPYNGDQLHCSAKGYARIGECICGAVMSNFGN